MQHKLHLTIHKILSFFDKEECVFFNIKYPGIEEKGL